MREEAIHKLYPNASTIYDGVRVFDAQGNPVTIDEQAVQAETARLQAEYDAKAYARNRAPEYPSIGDQLDALFHAGVFPTEMAALIRAVKDKYPKP